MAQLFPGGRVVKPQVPPELFPVFQTPTAAEVTEAFRSFRELQVAKGSQYLKATGVEPFNEPYIALWPYLT